MTPAAIFVFCLVAVILLTAVFYAGKAFGQELHERRQAEHARYAAESRANLALAVRNAA